MPDTLSWNHGITPVGSDQVTATPNPDSSGSRVYTPIAFERWAHGKYNDVNLDAPPQSNQGYSKMVLQVKDNWSQSTADQYPYEMEFGFSNLKLGNNMFASGKLGHNMFADLASCLGNVRSDTLFTLNLQEVKFLHSPLLHHFLALFVSGYKIYAFNADKCEVSAKPHSVQHILLLHSQLTNLICGQVCGQIDPTAPGSFEVLQDTGLLELLELENLRRFRHEQLLLEEEEGRLVGEEEMKDMERDLESKGYGMVDNMEKELESKGYGMVDNMEKELESKGYGMVDDMESNDVSEGDAYTNNDELYKSGDANLFTAPVHFSDFDHNVHKEEEEIEGWVPETDVDDWRNWWDEEEMMDCLVEKLTEHSVISSWVEM